MQNGRNKKNDRATIGWLVGKSKGQIPAIVFLSVLNILLAGTGVLYALITRGLLNLAQMHSEMEALIIRHVIILYAGYLAGTVLLQLLLSLLCKNSEERILAKLKIHYQQDLYQKILRKDYSRITAYHSGELTNYLFSDMNLIANGIVSLVPVVVGMIGRLVFAFIALLILTPAVSGVFLLGGVLVYFISRFLRGRMKVLHKRVQEADGKVRSFMQETIGNLLVIKAFSTEDKMNREADTLQKEHYRAMMKRKTISIFANTGLGFVFRTGTMLVMVWGAMNIATGGMLYGDLTAILQLVNQVQTPFAGLSGLLPTYYAILASAERVMELEELPDEEGGSLRDAKELYEKMTAISFSDLSFGYGRETIFEGANFTLNKGDFVAMLGISGIGKSTLFKLLLGVLRDFEGEISLCSEDGKIPLDRSMRSLFAYVPQGNMLLSGTLRDNITFVKEDATDEEIERVLRLSCSKKFVDELPDGLSTVIGEKGIGLSEGQVQRIAIARALLADAPILLLDEATSALDEETERELLCHLKELRNKTCLIISHKMAALEICNVHLRIEDKKIVVEEGK